MANSVARFIPQDIIYNVTAAVGKDEPLLKQCALVSSSFLLPSRKQLFSKISLRDDQACQRLHQLLIQKPDIQSFVRSIAITEDQWSEELSNSTSLLAILRLPFCCLENFSINTWNLWRWDSFSSGLKAAFSNIIHSPTLKTLMLKDIIHVPITLLLGIAHLTKLELIDILPREFNSEQSTLLIPEASKGVATTFSQTVIERCLWHLWGLTPGPTEPILLPFMCRSRYFEIAVEPDIAKLHDFDILSFLIYSLRHSLTSPAILEHLRLKILFRPCSNFSYQDKFYENLRAAEVWKHLDSIITHPIGSRLQRVDIDIYYANFRKRVSNDEILEVVLDGLPLLREKGILFVEATAGQPEYRSYDE